MTREETKQSIAIMQAYADGKHIEFFDKTNNEWVEIIHPLWNWHENDYRIKPEPKYRPFANADECWQEMLKHRPFGIMSSKNRKDYMSFMSLNDEGCDFCGYEGESFESAFDDIQFADGAPFGIKEEAKND